MISVIGKILGAAVLQLLIILAMILLVSLAVWWLVPAAFPAAALSFPNAVALTGLLYLVKAVFK